MLKISLFITILFTLKQQLAALEATTPLQNSWNNLPQHLGLFASHTLLASLDGLLITAYKNLDDNVSVLMVNDPREPVIIDISMFNVAKKLML